MLKLEALCHKIDCLYTTFLKDIQDDREFADVAKKFQFSKVFFSMRRSKHKSIDHLKDIHTLRDPLYSQSIVAWVLSPETEGQAARKGKKSSAHKYNQSAKFKNI